MDIERVAITKSLLDSLAETVSNKSNVPLPLTINQMKEAVSEIDVSAVVTPLNVNENGTYTAPTGVDGYSPVTVNVSGGGSGSLSDQVRFFDYDGTLVRSYSKADFNALTAMPANPSHSGLTAQGWNWSLSEAKAQLTAVPNGILNIGQMYTTDTGDTRIYIHISDDSPSNRMTFYVCFTSSTANNVTLNWGDGTVETKGSITATSYDHTYSTGGDYVIKLTVNNGSISFGGDGFSAIYGDITLENYHNGTRILRVEMGNNITSIGKSTFTGCYSLTNITIPNSVTSIETFAFQNCHSLRSITIPSGVTSIDASVFTSNYSLANVTIPNTVTSIGNSAFHNCHSIISITIPNGVTGIGSEAFYNCYSIMYITLPNTMTSIGDSAFYNCQSITSITIPNGVTSINSFTFFGCDSLTSIIIPNSVTEIYNGAFNQCFSLTNITMPSNITNINTNVFYKCVSLSSVTIPSGVTSIGQSAFYTCYALTSLTIPSNVTSIAKQAFQACYGIGEYHFKPTTPPTLANTNAFTGIQSDCKIYVPYSADHSVLNNYKSAQNWSSYASKMVEESA